MFDVKNEIQTTAVTDDFWWDFFEGGYIKPVSFLKNQSDIEAVNSAREILIKFKRTLYQNDLAEDM